MRTAKNRKKSIVQSDLFIVFLIILYKFTLDYIYAEILSPLYSYYGFTMDFSANKYMLTIGVVFILMKPMLNLLRKGNGSSMVIFLLSIVYFIPGCTVFALANLDDRYFVFFLVYWVILVSTQLLLPTIKGNLFHRIENPIIFNYIIIGFAVVAIMISGIYTGFRLHFTLKNIYDLRLSARELNLPSIAEYMLSASYVILPLGTMYYIVNKRRSMVQILMFVQFLSYSFNGKKSVLFTMLVVALIGKFYNENRQRWIVSAFVGLNFIGMVEALLGDGTSDIVRLIHRRVFFTPPLLGSYYFEFFSANGFDYLRQSILRWFGVTSTYAVPIQRLIGLQYYNNIETNANTGMCGDAFANFGWLGLFYPLLIILALRVFDKSSRNLDPRITALMWVLLFYKFINGTFFSIMLTGGFIITCIALEFCPRNPQFEKKSNE